MDSSELPEITIQQFIQQTAATHICPFCGTKAWSIEGERSLLAPDETGSYEQSRLDRVFLLECQGCGFVRMIRPFNILNRSIAAQARAKNEPKPEEEKQSEDS